MPCGNGYITDRDACWDCGCCFLDEPDDSELVAVCYTSLNGTAETVSSKFTDDASDVCNRSFKDAIGNVTVERTPNWQLIPWNGTVFFVIKMERVVTRMTASFHFGDGFRLQNISFLKTAGQPYYEAYFEYTYRCPGDFYRPRLEVQGQAKAENRLEVPAAPVLNVTQKLFADSYAENNGSFTFAIYTNIIYGNISIRVDFGEENASASVPTLALFNRSNLPEWALERWADRGDKPEGYRVGLLNHYYKRLGNVRATVLLTNADCMQNLSYQMEVKAGSQERFRQQLENMTVFSSSMETVVLPGESVEMIAWVAGADVTSASFDYGDGQSEDGLKIVSFTEKEEWPALPDWAAIGTGVTGKFIRLSHVYSVPGDYQGCLTVTHDSVAEWTASVNVSIRVWSFQDALGRIEVRMNTSDSISPFDFVAFAVTVERVVCNLTLEFDFGDISSASDGIVMHHGPSPENSSRTESIGPGSALVVHQYGYQPGVYVVKVLIAAANDPELRQSVILTNITVRSFSEAIGGIMFSSLNRLNLVLCDLSFQLQISHPWPLAEFSVAFADGTPATVVPKDTFQRIETPNGTFHVANVIHRFIVPGHFPVNLTIVDSISKNIQTFISNVEVITVRRIVEKISLKLNKGYAVCQGELVDITVTVERLPRHDVVISIDFGDGTEPRVVLLTKNTSSTSDLEKYSFVVSHLFKESTNFIVTASALNPCTSEDRFKTELRVEVGKRFSVALKGNDLDRVMLRVNPEHTPHTVVGEEVEFFAALPDFFDDPRPILLFYDGSEMELTSSSALNCSSFIPDWLPTEFSLSKARLFLVSHRFPKPGIYHVRLKVTNHPGRPGPIFTQDGVTVLSLQAAIGSVRIVPKVSSTGVASILVLAENYPPNTLTLWDFGDGSPPQWLELKRNVQLPEFASEFATPRRFSGLLSHTYEDLSVRRFTVRFQVGDGGQFRSFTREKRILMKPCDEMAVTFRNSTEGNFRLYSGYLWNESIVLRASFTPACYPMEFAGRCLLEKRNTLDAGSQSVRLHGVNCSVDWDNMSSLVNVTIQPSVLRRTGFYAVGVEVQFVNSLHFITRAKSNNTLIKIESYHQPLLAVLTRSMTEYNVSETFHLNAKLWQDPHPSELVAFSWVCLVAGSQPPPTANNIRHLSDCTSEPHRSDGSKSTLELPVSWLSFDPKKLPVAFHFQARLSTRNRTLASDWIRLTIVSGASPLIAIVCLYNCEEHVNPSESVLLSFSCSNCGTLEKLDKSWDLRPDQPETSANLSILSDFLKTRPEPDNDVFVIPIRIFQSLERDEVFMVTLQVRRRDATQSSSFRRLKVRQSAPRNRITAGTEDNSVVQISLFPGNEPIRVLTPAVGALHYSNNSSPSSAAGDGATSGNLAALAAIALLAPAAAILATVIIHRKRRSKDGTVVTSHGQSVART